MKEQAGQIIKAIAILIAAVAYAISHRYQVAATSTGNESNFMSFDNWTGHWNAPTK